MKKLLCILLAMIMVLSLTACSTKTTDSDQNDTTVNTPETPEVIPNSVYPMNVVDQAGREVTIEKEPQRIISAYYISTSLLIALDLEDDLVGIESKAEKRAIYKLSAPQLLDLQQVGTAKELDIEACTALEPDLMILPIKLKSVVPTLEELGMTVLLVNPETQELLTEMIQLIGTATNHTDEAEDLLGFIDANEKLLTDTLAGVNAPKVYLAGNSSMLNTAGDAMYQSDMIRLAGGTNVAKDIEDTYWAEIDYEQLLTWNPDYIIMAADASYTVEDVLSDPNLAECNAVKNENVYVVPNQAEAWDSPVPSSILGAIWLANILHPENISYDDCSKIINDYYDTFYSFNYGES